MNLPQDEALQWWEVTCVFEEHTALWAMVVGRDRDEAEYNFLRVLEYPVRTIVTRLVPCCQTTPGQIFTSVLDPELPRRAKLSIGRLRSD